MPPLAAGRHAVYAAADSAQDAFGSSAEKFGGMTEEESLADAPAQQSFVRRLDRAVARLRSERIKSQESSSADLVRQVAASARGELPAAPAEAENSDAATEYSATEHGAS